MAKPRKVDLSTAAFERRAKTAEQRARRAEKQLGQVDRYNPRNRRLKNSADVLRAAADSYASLVRKSTRGDGSAASLFQGRRRSSTAPKLTPSEKAAKTRAANAAKKAAENTRRMERARRYG